MRKNKTEKKLPYTIVKNGVVDVTDQFGEDLHVFGEYFGEGNEIDKEEHRSSRSDLRFMEKKLYNSRYTMLLKNYGPKAHGLHPMQEGDIRKHRNEYRTFKS